MIGLVMEGWRGMVGALRLLTFRPGGEAMFDVSLRGFWRSFGAILFALPLAALAHLERQHLGTTVSAETYFLIFFGTWLSFPLTAALAVAIAGARKRYLHWVVVHNWGVVWLYGVIAAILSLEVIGLINAQFRDFLFFLYGYLRILVHWRIAYVTLGLPTITAALTATIPAMTSFLVLVAISQALATGQAPAG
ncbi:hypothetical protein AWH62_01700 [Maricaulis sp. W15]|uniref:hypothetical protein n=1 Tax=Maricaulis sp. W15 TaxID=1772333 RepID=UPI000948BACE|nr:hypothetical protein [Maricaulis sp. W15]OLF81411.1 hypothetical protein AWH62_01700 [Maricaulis sp. W15]